jgi:hypothetical protein
MPELRKGFATLFVVCVALGAAIDATAAGDNPEDIYRSPDTWLCRPGRLDICAGDQSTTIVATDGSTTLESWKPDPAAPIDCFYIYPTISDDPHGNSSLVPGAGEKRAVEQQFARFASICRPYAPMYRQITLAGLSSIFTGKPLPMDSSLGYRDVLAAWKDYLKYDNQGRGVVLIGHSQGSRMLVDLMRNEIDGSAIQSRLVSALILGWNIEVPKGGNVGGSFKRIPLCNSAGQTGCVITYESFRAKASPPSSASLFGRAKTPDMVVGCTDPVALSGEELHAYLPVQSNLLGLGTNQDDWAKMAARVKTPFVSLPGLLDANCVSGEASYLAVSLHANPQDARPANVPGDIVIGGKVLDDWGLHLIDMNVAMGNLLDIVARQSAAYLSNGTQKAKAD